MLAEPSTLIFHLGYLFNAHAFRKQNSRGDVGGIFRLPEEYAHIKEVRSMVWALHIQLQSP